MMLPVLPLATGASSILEPLKSPGGNAPALVSIDGVVWHSGQLAHRPALTAPMMWNLARMV